MGRKNLPPVAISLLPPHPIMGSPHLHPAPQNPHVFPLFCFYPPLCLTVRLICTWDRPERKTKKKKQGLRWVMICWKKKKNVHIYIDNKGNERNRGCITRTVCCGLPSWALPLLHPLAPPLPHLPQSPSALPTWQMLIHSKWEERTESKTKAPKYKQLCEMEPLCIILRWCTLFLKTWMFMQDDAVHTTSILEEAGCHFVSQKEIFWV